LPGAQENLAAAVRAAQSHLDVEQKVAYPETTMEPVRERALTSEPSGPMGQVSGRVVCLHIRNGETRQRFVLLGVIHRPDQVLVLQCESAWQDRAKWESRFDQLLSTFQLVDGPSSELSNQGKAPPVP
jgi:hypothetical protein